MKIAIIIVRTIFALWFLFASVVFLFQIKMEAPPLPATAMNFMTALIGTGYLLTVVKVVELVCGLMLLTNRWAPLATVMLFPITVNIVLFHGFLDNPTSLPVCIGMLAAHLFLAFAYRKNYKTLFEQPIK
jgi:putative oxidoreductase